MTAETLRVTPRPGVLDIAPYMVGGSHLAGASRVVKLSANENPWGPSPKAAAAMRDAASRLALYPDADSAGLRAAIAEIHGIDPARIVCGNGSDELLQLLAFAYLRDGDEVVHSRHGFLLYPSYALMNGARPVAAPEMNLTSDVDALLAACNERTRLVYLANPNNPTGTRLNSQEVERLAAGVPDRALLVLDAAYAEYVDAEDYDGGLSLALRRPNVVMTRTFSKIHGLAALRVGWMVADEAVLSVVNRIRGPYNLNLAAQVAAAAAIRDVERTEWVKRETIRLRARLTAALEAAGIRCTPSEGNFVLAGFGEGEKGAAEADAFLRSRGIIARRVDAYGLPGWLRITVGDEPACDAVAAAVAEFRSAP